MKTTTNQLIYSLENYVDVYNYFAEQKKYGKNYL